MYNFSSFALAQLLDAVTNNVNNNNNKKFGANIFGLNSFRVFENGFYGICFKS